MVAPPLPVEGEPLERKREGGPRQRQVHISGPPPPRTRPLPAPASARDRWSPQDAPPRPAAGRHRLAGPRFSCPRRSPARD
ncbi:hypothetical protein MTO96_013125 [Rhipicephalus appendiculatus]